MAGIEILSEQTIYNTFVPEWVSIIAGACLLILWFIGSICMTLEWNKAISICIVGTLILGALTICGSIDNKKRINHIEYKVTIDDSVSINEFLDQYEIIDQEGKIYTIKEKK